MKFVADFHLHSKYSRATSPQMDLEILSKFAKVKGIKVLGTGDFTHPQWFLNLKKKLILKEPGLYSLKENDTRFILTTELSCIYTKKNKVRKTHIIVFAPSFEVVEKINTELGWSYNLKSDGRPILGIDVKELVKLILNISSDTFFVPAHIWTPWFSVFGSKSGFDSIEECFDDYAKYIYAVETGLSSDPPMNWRLSKLDNIALLSNSDSHSPQKIGREANVFNTDLSYKGIIEAIKSRDKSKFLYTIEFFPEEGRYHYDGHRLCNVVLSPKESKELKNICPKCGKPLTIGVLNRVEELADREEGFVPPNAIPYKSLVPLDEIISDAMNTESMSKKGEVDYNNLISKFGNELNVLIDAKEEDLERITLPQIAQGIVKVREGKVEKTPGYDGEYGKIRIVKNGASEESLLQQKLF